MTGDYRYLFFNNATLLLSAVLLIYLGLAAYEGKTGSICSKLKRLVDDGLAVKITKGEDKGKYRKLM